MGEKCDSFQFHRVFRDALRAFPDASRLKLYDAIIDYGLDDVKTELGDELEEMFISEVAKILAKRRQEEGD